MSSPVPGRRSPVPSVVVGLVAAVVGAVLWAVLVELTHYQIGYAAVGLGLLVGVGMARTAVPWTPLPAVSAVIAVAGCALGDLFIDIAEASRASDVSLMTGLGVVLTDPEAAGDVFAAGFEAFDLVFWAIAAWAAFRMTYSATRVQPAAAQPAAAQPASAQAAPAEPAGHEG